MNQRIISISLLFLYLILLSACEKTADHEVTNVNAQFSTNSGYEKLIVADDYSSHFDYVESHTYANYESIKYFGGGLYNVSHKLSTPSTPPVNTFNITFHDTKFEEIKVGTYEFLDGYPIADDVKKGVEIMWMNSEEWAEVLADYKKSDDYIDCIVEYGHMGNSDAEDICGAFLLNSGDFYRSSLLDQSSSEFVVTSVEPIESEKVWRCENPRGRVNDLIVEGNFNCKVVSRISMDRVQNISGTFKIHVPCAEKYDCN